MNDDLEILESTQEAQNQALFTQQQLYLSPLQHDNHLLSDGYTSTEFMSLPDGCESETWDVGPISSLLQYPFTGQEAYGDETFPLQPNQDIHSIITSARQRQIAHMEPKLQRYPNSRVSPQLPKNTQDSNAACAVPNPNRGSFEGMLAVKELTQKRESCKVLYTPPTPIWFPLVPVYSLFANSETSLTDINVSNRYQRYPFRRYIWPIQ
jgi:hypothetical protein